MSYSVSSADRGVAMSLTSVVAERYKGRPHFPSPPLFLSRSLLYLFYLYTRTLVLDKQVFCHRPTSTQSTPTYLCFMKLNIAFVATAIA